MNTLLLLLLLNSLIITIITLILLVKGQKDARFRKLAIVHMFAIIVLIIIDIINQPSLLTV